MSMLNFSSRCSRNQQPNRPPSGESEINHPFCSPSVRLVGQISVSPSGPPPPPQDRSLPTTRVHISILASPIYPWQRRGLSFVLVLLATSRQWRGRREAAYSASGLSRSFLTVLRTRKKSSLVLWHRWHPPPSEQRNLTEGPFSLSLSPPQKKRKGKTFLLSRITFPRLHICQPRERKRGSEDRIRSRRVPLLASLLLGQPTFFLVCPHYFKKTKIVLRECCAFVR